MVFADNQKGADEMSHYRHLTIEEREKLYLMKGQGKKDSEIARELGGHGPRLVENCGVTRRAGTHIVPPRRKGIMRTDGKTVGASTF